MTPLNFITGRVLHWGSTRNPAIYSKSSLGARFYHALGARRLSPPLFRILRTRVRSPNERARGNSFVSSRSLIGFSHSRQWPPGIVSSRVRSPPPAPFVGLLTRIYCTLTLRAYKRAHTLLQFSSPILTLVTGQAGCSQLGAKNGSLCTPAVRTHYKPDERGWRRAYDALWTLFRVANGASKKTQERARGNERASRSFSDSLSLVQGIPKNLGDSHRAYNAW